MLQTLRQPKWIAATVLVVALAALFVGLGLWQLDRLEQRRALNQMGEERMSQEAELLHSVLGEAGGDVDSLQYRRVYVTGVFDRGEEVLIRSQVELGQAGFHVITPLVTDEGWAVLVNRGWVPLGMDTPPVEIPPTPGRQRVEGWLQLTQTRPSLGPEDAAGEQQIFNRVDIGRIGEQTPYDLAAVYLVAMGEEVTELPVPVDPPDFTNEGAHFAYAIQWFGFAAVTLVGFYFLMRRRGGTQAARRR
jgi:cytochrome oxidase assembly protein ShyY1